MLGVFRSTARFKVVKELGVGGMGAVYEVIDRELDRPLALKWLQRLDPQALLRFKSEFRVACGIDHRNLVSLGELIVDNGRWFFTMELISGVDFLSFVRSPRSSYDEDRLRSVLGQLAAGLMALHAADQVHRDIKPSNVLVTESGRLTLLDFGVAKALHVRSNLSSGAVVGTSEYMAPEQAMGQTVGAPADWYSVGVLLFQALTGEVPFQGDHVQISLSKYRNDPPRPRDRLATVPADLDELCFRLMQREPGQRPGGNDILHAIGRAPSRGSALADTAHEHEQPHFLGRHDELVALERAFTDSRHRPIIARVSGPAGIGKSALITEFRTRLRMRSGNALILSSRCSTREKVPFKAVDPAIDALTHWLADRRRDELSTLIPDDVGALAQVFPVLRRLRPIARAVRPDGEGDNWPDLYRRAGVALAEMLRRIAAQRPIALLIDDM
ncbi:MAG: serine/threonine-protein kinase, partial [Myxococcota bacterium]